MKRYEIINGCDGLERNETIDGDYVLYTESQARIQRLEEALEWFCKRVESGEVRSKKTYEKFKQLLNDEHRNQL